MYMSKKILFVILDGVGDRVLNGRTPLEVAVKPNMDFIAKNGVQGIVDVISPGVIPGSDTAHLSLMGYDPYKSYTGRGPLEAMGAGIEVKPGDIGFRVNFATVDENWIIKDRRAGRIKDARPLAEALDGMEIDGVKIILKATVEHRGALVLRGEGLSDKITDADPHEVGKPVLEVKPLDDTPEAKRTAEIVNKFIRKSYEILKDHPLNKEREKQGLPPANIVLPRGPGKVPHLQSFEDKWGIKGIFIAGVALLKGLGRFAGLPAPDLEGATGGYDTNPMVKIERALKFLYEEDGDIAFINFKATDVAGHDMNFEKKVEMIEKADKMFEMVLDKKDLVIAITGDHSTPVTKGDHSGDPVPLVLYAPNIRTDGTLHFSEREAAMGGLGRIRGFDIMPMLMDLSDKAHKFGA
ncbi:2,3-bisphosphoglycerate-independent phosphoglycerate mutase [bacterium 3DAC]|nr:2,3-bisphosphoglycerate-independent phosphoglycerate mutase [Dictyoglomota bacterium]UZN22995.1 2,3-bisphosphoglycerate-independent phosphoglycerate mutase [bacterium 3DAC]